MVTRQIAGETVLVPIRSGAADLDFIYTSNDTGTTIWECLDGETTVDQIVETICQEYDVPAEEATQDVMDFLSLWKRRVWCIPLRVHDRDISYPGHSGPSTS